LLLLSTVNNIIVSGEAILSTCCTLSKNPTPLSAISLVFGPSGLIQQPPQSSFPPMIRGLDKTLIFFN